MSSEKHSGRRRQYLDAMGIQTWELCTEIAAAPKATLKVKAYDVRLNDPSRKRSVELEQNQYLGDQVLPDESIWEALKIRVAGCTKCGLHTTRTQTVFGVGSHNASWMVIGEAPGVSEDQQGEPFVGKAGMLLNEMLRALGLKREEVFITNILKCRPPNNRDPHPNEVESCEPYLKRQVALVKPKIILAVGRIAAQNLLKTDVPLGKLRGKCHYYGEIPVVVVYHPAYLLRSPLEKRRAWTDLQFALRLFKENV